MKPNFSLKWLFVGTAAIALLVASAIHPSQLLAVVLTIGVLASFVVGCAIWFRKGERCPWTICSYVVMGGFVFVSPLCVGTLLPGWLLEPHSQVVFRMVGDPFEADAEQLPVAFVIAHCWLTILYALTGTGVTWGLVRLAGSDGVAGR